MGNSERCFWYYEGLFSVTVNLLQFFGWTIWMEGGFPMESRKFKGNQVMVITKLRGEFCWSGGRLMAVSSDHWTFQFGQRHVLRHVQVVWVQGDKRYWGQVLLFLWRHSVEWHVGCVLDIPGYLCAEWQSLCGKIVVTVNTLIPTLHQIPC